MRVYNSIKIYLCVLILFVTACTPVQTLYFSNKYKLYTTLELIKDRDYKLLSIDTLDSSYRIRYRERR